MTPAPPEGITQQITALRRLVVSGAEATSRIAIRPVFVDDAGRRRRLITGFGYLAALACVGYIVIVGISLTAGPTGPLAAMPDPKPPNLVEELVAPSAVPVASTTRAVAIARPTALPTSTPTSTQQPRPVRPAAPLVIAPPPPTMVPSTTPVTPSVTTTTHATTTSNPCGRRRECTSTTTPQTSDSVTTTPAKPPSASPDPSLGQ
jgi:hypothetical protein